MGQLQQVRTEEEVNASPIPDPIQANDENVVSNNDQLPHHESPHDTPAPVSDNMESVTQWSTHIPKLSALILHTQEYLQNKVLA
jgi:hypothetical protein